MAVRDADVLTGEVPSPRFLMRLGRSMRGQLVAMGPMLLGVSLAL